MEEIRNAELNQLINNEIAKWFFDFINDRQRLTKFVQRSLRFVSILGNILSSRRFIYIFNYQFSSSYTTEDG